MKIHLILRQLVFIFLLAFPVHGLPPVNPVLLQVTKQFTNYIHNHPQEKVYVHVDKKQTTLGETIWFKVYLMDAASHTETAASSLVYVDLFNPQNRIVETWHIHPSPEIAAGDFFIPLDSLPGTYTLRAYTQYMRNFDEAFFYHQAIRVWNPYDSIEHEEPEVPVLIPTDLPLQQWEQPTHLLIQFFPEGGDLVNGISSKVAFKITDQQGTHQEVKTKIFDQGGKFITPALSTGKGLGLFTLSPEAGNSYYAEFSFEGKTIKFPLPTALEKGYALQVNYKPGDQSSLYLKTDIQDGLKGAFVIAQMQGKIIFTMEANSNALEVKAPFSTLELPDGICHFTLFNPKGEPQCERLIFIQNPQNRINCRLQTDKSTYSLREEVRVDLDLGDFELEPVEANLSVAVIDHTSVADQAGGGNIESYLLLSSEFTEPLDPADFFPDTADHKTRQIQDLVMMTQGWRRFVWKQILEEEDKDPWQYEVENGFSLAGITTSLEKINKPLSTEVFLSFLGPDGIQRYDQRSGPDGFFQFSNLIFPDTTQLLLQANRVNPKKEQAKSKKSNTKSNERTGPQGNRNVSIVMKKVTAPEFNWSPIHTGEKPDPSSEYLADRRRINRIDSVYRNDWQIDLDEIQIRGRKPEEPKEDLFKTYFGTPSHRLILDSIHGIFGSMTIFDVIRGRVPGVQVFGSGFSQYAMIRGPGSLRGSNYAQIFLNGLSLDNESASSLSIHDVAAIDVYTGAAAGLFGARGAGGAIIIHTRSASNTRPVSFSRVDTTGILRLQHPGYYKAREFYSPNYKVPVPEHQKPDFRTTLYWNPELISTLPGQYSFSFFTCDKRGDYQIVIEGLSQDGRPVYKKAFIQVR